MARPWLALSSVVAAPCVAGEPVGGAVGAVRAVSGAAGRAVGALCAARPAAAAAGQPARRLCDCVGPAERATLSAHQDLGAGNVAVRAAGSEQWGAGCAVS